MNFLMTVASELPQSVSFDFASRFQPGDAGYVLAGYPGASSFYEDDGETTPATDSGTDPLGAVTDIGPNGNDVKQTLSANRATYYNEGGVRSWETGSAKWLRASTDVAVSEAFTAVAVYKLRSIDGNGSPVFSNFVNGGWPVGGFFALRQLFAAPYNLLSGMAATNSANAREVTGATNEGPAVIAVWRRTGTGADATTLTVYAMDGSVIDTATSTQDAAAGFVYEGYADGSLSSGTIRRSFSMFHARAWSTDDVTALVTFLRRTDVLGSW